MLALECWENGEGGDHAEDGFRRKFQTHSITTCYVKLKKSIKVQAEKGNAKLAIESRETTQSLTRNLIEMPIQASICPKCPRLTFPTMVIAWSPPMEFVVPALEN